MLRVFSSSGLLYSNGCGDSVHISFYYASKPSSVHTLKCRLYAACHCFQRLPYFCLTQHTYHLLFLHVNLLSQPFPHHLRRSRRDFNKTNAILLRTHKKLRSLSIVCSRVSSWNTHTQSLSRFASLSRYYYFIKWD